MTFITTQELCKTYQTKTGPVHAFDGLNPSVEQGTVRGLPGPNGAGRTAFMKVLTTLLRLESGRASAVGIDVFADPVKVRPLIGTPGQYAAVDEVLTARENPALVDRLYRTRTCQAKRCAGEPLKAFDPTGAADRPLKGLSGGMWRRADLTGALVISPSVLFLDELTTGFDLQIQIGLWEVIRERVGEGTTILLTTQYLEETDQPADSISMISRGHVIAEGTADELKVSVGDKHIELIPVDEADTDRTWRIVTPSTGTEVAATRRVLMAQVGDPTAVLIAALKVLGEEGVELHDAGARRPTLDNIFPTLTGHAAEEQEVTV